MSNPTAGILLLILASALIAIGVSDKGRQILGILFNNQTETESPTPNKNTPNSSGSQQPPQSYSGSMFDAGGRFVNYVYGYVGEAPARPVTGGVSTI